MKQRKLATPPKEIVQTGASNRLKRAIFTSRRRILPFFLSVVMAIVFVNLFSGSLFNISAFQIQLKALITWPAGSKLIIPPVGEIAARTHPFPLAFQVTLTNINLDILKGFFEQPINKALLIKLVQTQAPRILYVFITKIFLLAMVGGVAGAFLAGRRRALPLLRAGLAGLLVVAIVVGGTYYTYNVAAFQHPQYRGVLEAAPWMVGFVEQSLVKVNKLGEQMEVLAGNLYKLFERVDSLEPLGTVNGDLRILHISDTHNNPAALDFVAQVIKSFGVDAIIDTGDLTDFGTPLETGLVSRLRLFKVPYFFVPGNHDSPEIISFLRRLPNVRILNNRVVEFKGLRILGSPDPGAASLSPEPPAPDAANRKIAEIQGILESLDTPPDLLAIHNYRIARGFIGLVPVILHGHDHRMRVSVERGTAVIDAGTTGAAGIRGLQTVEEGVPYSVAMLYFSRRVAGPEVSPGGPAQPANQALTEPGKVATQYRLIAVDTIRVYSLQAGFSLERILIPEPGKDKDTEPRVLSSEGLNSLAAGSVQ
ncbi:MAG: metallophosphoesterase family protein [Syntrophothermus sp.]